MAQVTRLREIIQGPGIGVAPGAHDVLSAKLIEQAGFPAIFTSGFGLSASTLGLPDIGLLTMTETLDRVRRIVDAEGGKTPFLSARELEELGFKLVIFPLSGLFAATRAVQEVALHLKANGTTAGYNDMVSFGEFEEIIGAQHFRKIEAQFAIRG